MTSYVVYGYFVVISTFGKHFSDFKCTVLRTFLPIKVPDTHGLDTDVADKLTAAVDGNNVAMVYNASPQGATDCVDGKLCMLEEFVRGFIDVMQNKWVRDAETYFDMTQEEYDLIKPKRMEEMLMLTKEFKTFLAEKGQCGKSLVSLKIGVTYT